MPADHPARHLARRHVLAGLGVSLYVALGLGANPLLAETPAEDLSERLGKLREGSMRALIIQDTPKPAPLDIPFRDENNEEMTLADLRGKAVLVNFWATWCPPCRKEMPAIADLARQLEGEPFVAATISVGRDDHKALRRFLDSLGATNLPAWRDPTMQLALAMGARGLPVSVLLDKEGREVARMIGEAQWNSPSAIAIIKELIAAR